MQYYTHKAKTEEEKAEAKRKKTIVLQDGTERLCDSEKEARYYREVLAPMQTAGVIEKIDFHPQYLLLEAFDKGDIHHKREVVELDYGIQIAGEDGPYQLIDVKDTYDKNLMDPVSLLKKAWFDSRFDTLLRWVVYCKKFGGWISWEEYWEKKKAEMNTPEAKAARKAKREKKKREKEANKA
jgi:hypothetical protein